LLFQTAQITANGHLGHVELLAQLMHGQEAALAHQVHNLFVSISVSHVISRFVQSQTDYTVKN
jgi:hypothetical protein